MWENGKIINGQRVGKIKITFKVQHFYKISVENPKKFLKIN